VHIYAYTGLKIDQPVYGIKNQAGQFSVGYIRKMSCVLTRLHLSVMA
jgi:hypothetical protein